VFAALTRHGLRPARGEPPLPLLEVRLARARRRARASARRTRAGCAAQPPLACADLCATLAPAATAGLQVGAVNTQLLSMPWLAVRAIDLRSTHPRIEQRDFFELTPAAEYGAVVCSMARCCCFLCAHVCVRVLRGMDAQQVLNCVPDALSRGAMLRGMRAHLRASGLLFVMLPLRCLTHSPFTTHDRFADALAAAGFEVRVKRAMRSAAHVGLWTRFAARSSQPLLR
jgi:hypothetical protein